MSCGVGRRLGSDPALLWLWCRTVAMALIRLLAWESPYAAGAAQEMEKRQEKKKKEEEELALLGGERAMGDEALALFGELDASSSLS